ncbi:MAG: NifB/NifX family molybdenum-iron cluster-binding protein [Phycisphaerae bacterium]|nr:NifB/NifX family molybdenum-iron cluster-binding protein [Phycisphaerae bacterium]
MRIAITASGPTLDAAVDPRFGRCPYFLIVDPRDLAFEAIENASVALGQGAGIQSAQLMAEKGVTSVLTGNCGPNAHQTLSAAGIVVIVGCSGAVRDVIQQYKAGQLSATNQPNVAGHSGMAGAPGPAQGQPTPSQQPPMPGRGMGMGRGMGRGGGMGRGRGMGQGMGRGGGTGGGPPGANPAFTPPPAQSLSKEEEMAMLKQQTEAMAEQMRQIQQRIQQLEQGE